MKKLLHLALLASAAGFLGASCTTYVDPGMDDTATTTTTTTRAVDTPIGTSRVTAEERTTTTRY